ncbi:MAG: AI-2E family transporter [Nocardioidaceae bacterium]
MSSLGRMIDRLRSDSRQDVTGVPDDDQGLVVDNLPDQTQEAKQAPLPQEPAPVPRPVEIPHGVEIAAAWSWRLLLIAAAGGLIFWLLRFFREVTVPLAIALLITALATPFVDLLGRLGLPRGLATAITVIGGLAVVVGMLALVGQQVTTQLSDLRGEVVEGLQQIEDWLQDGPLNLSDADISAMVDRVQETFSSGNGEVVTRVTEVGTTVTRVAAGSFIVLFATYFFLYQGNRIWGFLVGLFPRPARRQLDASGRRAWVSLTAFVRATVLVALVDAVGIALAAAVLRVPLALAIGVLVFLGAFVPLVGALVTGFVAVLVALVSQGFYISLAMLGAVVLVQQIEAHVLQPFLLGRLVSLHPLAVIIAIAAGIVVAGIVGALIAVPLVACGSAIIKHIAGEAEQERVRRRIRRPRPRPV